MSEGMQCTVGCYICSSCQLEEKVEDLTEAPYSMIAWGYILFRIRLPSRKAHEAQNEVCFVDYFATTVPCTVTSRTVA